MMIHQKCSSLRVMPVSHKKTASISNKVLLNAELQGEQRVNDLVIPDDIDIDIREVCFLIIQLLSTSPCQKTLGVLWNELSEHKLLPRRYHAWYSRSGMHSEEKNDDGVSFPLSYEELVHRYSHIKKDHMVKLLKQLMLTSAHPSLRMGSRPNAADVPTLLGSGRFSLLSSDGDEKNQLKRLPSYLRWPHMQADQVHALSLRAIGGGFTRHHRAPSIHAASNAIAKPSTMIQKMQNIKKLRGHRNAVYCAIFDRSGRYVITGSDDRLVKIWSMETAFCLASCRGHEGDITDLAVSSNNALVASASNDFVIRVWRLPDGVPISVLQGHTGAVTAIAFSPRTSSSTVYQLLSSSDDGTCRIWDARYSQAKPRIYIPRPVDSTTGQNNLTSTSGSQQNHQILCCAYNANGTVFVTGSSDTLARVWSACKSGAEDSEQPNHEIDVLCGHENDVNYVQFSGCTVTPRSTPADCSKEENGLKFKNLWFCHDNIVTCSRDGSAIIWIPRSRRSHGKVGRWMKAYHLKVPPPPLPPQPPRGGPRQRILPTPRGVNMIVWSLDNRFVLAAIMDCRICVWNASDGSLVHSLTGHTESTYVLDVHPFNPRIAMSAGYDGKTIIWDIWEGQPVRTFEIGRFKLVDGKFSTDGTSIVLSDEVGQIYLISTGQGEAHKDAKYDQFFLGDYRPLIRDSIGNFLDQETQLAPHRRNFQDLLCDSSMIPYPEPYQSMYQRHRLRMLGVEWRPSTINFATGPDFSLGEDFQVMPIADLDAIFDVPELLDPTYWELPEYEARSDEDSEYNVSDEYASDRGHESLSPSSCSDTDSDPENDEFERKEIDGLRRSKRKKEVAEVEFTSCRRRVKRRYVDVRGGKRTRSKHKKSKRRSSEATSSRPQRLSARNAACGFPRIPDTDSDEEAVYDSDSSFSESEYVQDFSNQNDEALEESNPTGGTSPFDLIKESEPQANAGGNRRLVLKFSVRDSKKPLVSGTSALLCDEKDAVYSKSPVFTTEECDEKVKVGYEDPGPSSASAIAPKTNGRNKIKLKYKGLCKEFSDPSQTSVIEGAGSSRHVADIVTDDSLTNGSTIPYLGANNRHLLLDADNAGEKLYSHCNEGGEHANCEDQMRTCSFSSDVKRYVQPKSTKLTIKYGKAILGKQNPMTVGELSSPVRWPIRNDTTVGDNISNTYISNYYKTDCDISDSEVDALCGTRSDELKATSIQPSSVKHKLKLKKSEGSVGTSSWTLNSFTMKSRSSRSRHSSINHSVPSPPSTRQSNVNLKKISWLLLYEHEVGYRYIPQLGDEVVYMRQGHEQYMENFGPSEGRVGASLRGKLRAVETCKVEGLDYSTVPSGESCCKIVLKFTDACSNVFGKTLRITLPELVNFPDFLVEKSWYDATMSKIWTPGDSCMIWWRNDVEEESGSWWEGQVISSEPKSYEFPDSPWERYLVKYLVKYDDESGNAELHSPWEMHEAADRCEHSHIDFRISNELLSCFEKLETSERKGKVLRGIERLNEVSKKPDFLNRFPVPLSPYVIKLRLANNYYRSLAAVKHDIEVTIANARSYYGNRNHDLLDRVEGYFEKKLLELKV